MLLNNRLRLAVFTGSIAGAATAFSRDDVTPTADQEANAPIQFQEKSALEAPAGPKRSRRGPPPTISDFGGVEYDVNPDGTSTSHMEIGGKRIDPETQETRLPEGDDFSTVERSKIGSFDDRTSSEVKTIGSATAEQAANASTTKDYSLIAAAVVCAAIALLLWWTMRQPPKSD